MRRGRRGVSVRRRGKALGNDNRAPESACTLQRLKGSRSCGKDDDTCSLWGWGRPEVMGCGLLSGRERWACGPVHVVLAMRCRGCVSMASLRCLELQRRQLLHHTRPALADVYLHLTRPRTHHCGSNDLVGEEACCQSEPPLRWRGWALGEPWDSR